MRRRAALISLLALACTRPRAYPGLDQYPLRAAAATLFADVRPFEARFIAGRFRPCPADHPRLPSTCDPRLPEAIQRRAAELAGRVSQALQDPASTDAVWTSAILDLVSGSRDERSLSRIIGALHEVVARDPASAAALNDAAVAHFVRMGLRDRPEELLEAVTIGWKAVQADPGSAVARYNLALYLDQLQLRSRAEASYAAARQVETDPRWAADIDRRAARTQAHSAIRWPPPPPSQAFPSVALIDSAAKLDAETVRDYAMEQLLPYWARTKALDAMSAVGRALAAVGDSTIAWTAATLEHLEGGDADIVSRSVLSLEAAQALNRTERYSEARPQYEQAILGLGRGLPRTSDPRRLALRDLAALRLGMLQIHAGRFGAADSIHRTLIARYTGHLGAETLVGQAQWQLAISEGRQNRIGSAIRAFEAAAGALASAGDSISLASVRAELVEGYELVGQYSAALRSGLAGLAALRRHGPSAAWGTALVGVGASLERMGAVVPAIEVQREIIAYAERDGRPSDRAEAFAHLARGLAEIGQHDAAARAIDSGWTALGAAPDSGVVARLGAELDDVAGSVIQGGVPDSARVRLDRAIRYYEHQGLTVKLGPPLAARADLAWRGGNPVAARRDLERAAKQLTGLVRAATTPAERAALVGAKGAVYLRLTTLALETGDTLGAFLFAERARLSGSDADEEPAAPFDDRAVLALTPLEGRLVSWLIVDGRMTARDTAVSATTLRQKMERLERALQSGADSATTEALSIDLYRLLHEPAVNNLRPGQRLTIVADGFLQRVPFPALQLPRSRRYLIEEREIALGTRVSRGRPRKPGRGGERTLLVDGSSFDRDLFPDLEPIPFAAGEIAALRRARPGADVVAGDSVSATRMAGLLPRYGIIHFAGHARSVDDYPDQSHIVMAYRSSVTTGHLLTGSAIERLDLSGTSLVVLSACGTVPSAQGRWSGKGGLSRSFLLAGAGAVVSSVWQADDRGVGELMARFYIANPAADPVTALRVAQLGLLRDPRYGPRAARIWGAFRVEY